MRGAGSPEPPVVPPAVEPSKPAEMMTPNGDGSFTSQSPPPPNAYNTTETRVRGRDGVDRVSYRFRLRTMEPVKPAPAQDIRAEAKATGYDTKTIRAVIKIRAMDKAAREEQEALLDTYLSALGLL